MVTLDWMKIFLMQPPRRRQMDVLVCYLWMVIVPTTPWNSLSMHGLTTSSSWDTPPLHTRLTGAGRRLLRENEKGVSQGDQPV
jgi:hypothetical protein